MGICIRSTETPKSQGEKTGGITLEDEIESLTPIQKAERQSFIAVQTQSLDRVYSLSRQLIRVKEEGRRRKINSDQAIKEVMNAPFMLKHIKQDMLNDALDDIAKTYPILADNLRSKDEKVREQGMRLLDTMIKEMESRD